MGLLWVWHSKLLFMIRHEKPEALWQYAVDSAMSDLSTWLPNHSVHVLNQLTLHWLFLGSFGAASFEFSLNALNITLTSHWIISNWMKKHHFHVFFIWILQLNEDGIMCIKPTKKNTFMTLQRCTSVQTTYAISEYCHFRYNWLR